METGEEVVVVPFNVTQLVTLGRLVPSGTAHTYITVVAVTEAETTVTGVPRLGGPG